MIENEAFNVLKTKGYNLEHNFGHGQRNLSTTSLRYPQDSGPFHLHSEALNDTKG